MSLPPLFCTVKLLSVDKSGPLVYTITVFAPGNPAAENNPTS